MLSAAPAAEIVLSFAVNPTSGALTLIDSDPAGDSLAVDPLGRFLYAVDSGASTVSSFTIAADGTLTATPSSPILLGTGITAAAVDASGRYLYAADPAMGNALPSRPRACRCC